MSQQNATGTLFLVLIALICTAVRSEESPYVFSMTCKVTAMNNQFASPEGRQKAVEWFRAHGITKLYLETYRHGEEVSEERIRTVRDAFQAAGFEVGGCITTTQLNRDLKNPPLVCCYSDPSARAFLTRIVERTARYFDFVILDDFLFTHCSCPLCKKVDRRELMRGVCRDLILCPSRKINPKCCWIIKYPCWYEGFFAAGYDIVEETRILGASWIGTETREPDSIAAGRRPQTQASWIQGWMNDVVPGQCGGAWFDPIDTKPETFVEQARQTILGGARESLLHCFDYLGTDQPGIAIHGTDTQIKQGRADAEAFRQEAPELLKLAEKLRTMEPQGVLLPKQPNADNGSEPYFCSFVGLLGIPVLPAARLKDAPAILLSSQSLQFENLNGYLLDADRSGKPIVLTDYLFWRLPSETKQKMLNGQKYVEGQQEPFLVQKISDKFSILHLHEKDYWKLLDLPIQEIQYLRDQLTAPFGFRFSCPTRVSIHLFCSRTNPAATLIAVENFNNTPVEAALTFASPKEYRLTQSFPKSSSVRQEQAETSVTLQLGPRSLAVLETFTTK